MEFVSNSLIILALFVFLFGLYQMIVPIIPFENKSEPFVYMKKGFKIVLISVLILIAGVIV